MSAYHLRKTEVIYELNIRNLCTKGTIGDLRKRLSQHIALNTSIDTAVVNSLDTDTELEECEVKYQDLSTLVSDYEGNHNDNEYHRIVARLWHLYLRTERIPVGEAEDEDCEQTKESLVKGCKDLLDAFKDWKLTTKVLSQSDQTSSIGHQKLESSAVEQKDSHLDNLETPELPHINVLHEKDVIREDERRLVEDRRFLEETQLQDLRRHQEDQLCQEEIRIREERRKQEEKWKQEDRRLQEERRQQEEKWRAQELRLQELMKQGNDNSSEKNLLRRQRREELLHSNEKGEGSRPRYVPVYKWGLKFDNSGGSIAAFLERVEELRRARGVTHQELYESAVDLFAGPALVWYRAAAKRISSWYQLTRELREVFQPVDYDLRLHQEIFNRLQGDKEPLDLYVAAMEGLYGRLAVPVPEKTRLAQIYNNLHPQLQDRLALFSIETLDQLRSMGRRAEAGRLSMTRIRSSPKAEEMLEPDLAYQDPNRQTSGRVAGIKRTPQPDRRVVSCWNCGETGHRFRFCRNPKKKFCYGCGKDKTFKRDCISCNPKNGQSWESGTQ